MVETAATVDTATLRSYLSDHMAGAKAGVGFAKKLAENSPGDRFLEDLVKNIEEDQAALERVMDKVGGDESGLKSAGAHIGQALSSALSGAGGSGTDSTEQLGMVRQAELLVMGITAKVCLWETLNNVADADERLSGFNFQRLVESARSQRDELQALRLKMSRKALMH